MAVLGIRHVLAALLILQLGSLTGAQSDLPTTTGTFCTATVGCTTILSSPGSASTLSSSATVSTTRPSVASGTVVVDASGGGQFTAINPAISYAQTYAQPTIIIRAGTYNEAVNVLGSAALTIIGESSMPEDYSKNQVIISSTTTPMSIGTNAVLGISWKNINFVNPLVGSNSPTVSLRGAMNAFYNCQFISAGGNSITLTLGTTLIANSYVEGTTKLFSGYIGMYIFGSTIAATASSATIIYSHGYGTPVQYSQTVLDSCSIIQKPGTTNTYVYLAGPNGDGSQAVFKYTSMASMIAPGGTRAVGTNGFYGEYSTTGPGSFSNDPTRVDTLMTAAMLANSTIDYVMANSFTGYSTPTTSWIDSTVLEAIAKANAAAAAAVSSSSSASTPSTSDLSSSAQSTSTSILSTSSSSSSSTTVTLSPSLSSPSSSSNGVPTTISTTLGTSSSSTTSSSLALSSSSSLTCVLPTSIPSTAKVVGPSNSCAGYTSIAAAVAALPADSTTQYIYILAGTYTEQISSVSRVGATIFRGESDNTLSQSSNLVNIQYSGSVLSSAGGSEEYAVFRSTQYNAKKYAFYNINFANIAPMSPNYIAIAMDIKAQQVGFYSCGFTSGQGTFLANYGTFYLSGCRIEGSQDFIWGYGATYISNSLIVSNAPGYAIAAQSYVTAYRSQIVFDTCAFVPKTTDSMSQSTYLGRDYTSFAKVAVINSFLDGHISPAGWLIKSATTNVTFAEFNNTGPSSTTSSRASDAQMLTDGSAYSAANVLGDLSWIDTSAIVPFKGFPPSLIAASLTSTATSSSPTASVTAAALPTYVVSLTPNATQYGNITSAIKALPNDGAEKVILVMPGTYTEQIIVNRKGKVTIRGMTSFPNDYSQNEVMVQFTYGVSTNAGQNELTPVINAKKTDGTGLALYNIDFQNLFPQTNNYAALAADFYGTNMAAYGCSFIGYQDTLLANQGTQLFSNCYIEGSVDFIWGFSKAYFHSCVIAANTARTSISAQSRASADAPGGYVFDQCIVTYTSTYGSNFGLTYLGRPYSSYSIAVYKNSYLDKNINTAGWSVWQTSNPQTSNVLFGEYNNVGPSAWTSSTTRASFATNLTESQAAAYDIATFLGSTTWIDSYAYNLVPSFSFNATGTTIPASNTAPTGPNATEAANATSSHPRSGTVPPSGAVLVSADTAVANSFANLTAALASLPKDITSQVIFMYPGSYTEQVSVNRAGPVTIIGYQSGNVGQTYTGNQVTVTYSRGLSVVAPIPAGHTNAETAIIATASSKISFYNVNFINTANSDGAIPSYVTLAGSTYGDQIGFYGCSFIGWQDTLLTGNPSGYAYYESSYIEGAIDFIWGYSLSYFKGCTMAAKKAKSCITAQSRASLTAIGGYIFDQCLFTAASSATVDLNQLVYLGRPYSQYAKVIIKYSYLDSIIQPAGWKAWSATDSRLSDATFAEYQNTGPGNWENNAAARVAFGNATLLTSDIYALSSVMATTSWIDMTYWDSIITPQPAVATTPNTTVVGNSTTPPIGACIVSKTSIAGYTTYSTIAQCIAILPSTSVVSTIFIYPGTYSEQLTFNRSGATIFKGYSDTPGSFSTNQVIIQNSHGVDTQGDASNSDSATFYSRGKNVKFYNINLVNSFGTTKNYASLGFAIGNNGNASFYGCQVIGNQDTFNINVGASVFVYNSYIEGSVDFIWGSGSAYFLSSTIAPNTNGISITADKRASNTSIGGIVFDQCTVTPSAAGASVAGMTGSISLGRPWNQYARVAYIKTYLDASVSAAGWQQWSTSSPNTNGVFFGEYQNSGPGAESSSRVSFSHQMTDEEATAFQLTSFFSRTSWIDFTALTIQPFSVGISPVVFTVTVTPTNTPAPITMMTTDTILTTFAVSLLTITKNITEKLSTTLITTQPDLYKSTTLLFTTTSFSLITPLPVTSTSTINGVVYQTVTLSGAQSTQTVTTTSKVTQSTTVTPVAITQVQTIIVSELYTSIITPKPVSQTTVLFSTETSLVTSTPKPVTTTLESLFTTTQSYTAGIPTVNVLLTSTITTATTKIVTPKGVTSTSTELTTIPPGPTVTVVGKKVITSMVSITSVVTKTVKSATTLTCTPAAKLKRDVGMRRAASSDSSVSTPTITTTYTLPQSTSIFFISYLTTSTVTKAGLKTTQTNTYTSFRYSTIVVPGSTYTNTVSSTKLIPKTSTLPVSTATLLTTLEGTSVSTTSLKGTTTTERSTVISVVKTITSTLPPETINSLTTRTTTSTELSTLPVESFTTTTTSLKMITATTVLESSTITITKLSTLTIATTSTPPGITLTKEILKTVTELGTITLPTSTSVIFKTSISREPTPTLTITKTTVKTTTVKSTSTVTVTSTKIPKGLPACGA